MPIFKTKRVGWLGQSAKDESYMKKIDEKTDRMMRATFEKKSTRKKRSQKEIDRELFLSKQLSLPFYKK